MTNKCNTVLYVGVTSNLAKRVWQHQNHVYPKSFTARYRCYKLVWYEESATIMDAIWREKQIKGGSRQKKIDLIVARNPQWDDLTIYY